ncbi:hypothetical protein CCM_05443 [Cordyceps militaris CM01]|uniref:DUF7492 domain-containing protein n=2 Tax=Cordyceps militaris TaxID=73501 RepID=G3JJP5_CORMM|nr:uncharacterized protein CCM_05443 [Cordyceps militaris CM01]ATY58641.1 hypothetical protein A9K55_002803 [Cordyceps militaris]EGX91285.1 hypothetical protein CCM_05443 [Cordyceps militaris CM01]
MRPSPSTPAALLAASLASLAHAHSWIEELYRIAPGGAYTGDPGYARGWVSRDSKDPAWNDKIPQCLLPPAGQAAYSGNEILNKYKAEAAPKFPLLQAAPGDHIAIIHLENGHTSLPQNQPKKPLNRGTVFIYGTADPKPEERLFDVHLLWNRAGTGGDKRGKLLATRNYDDGQCYQPNPGEISNQRAKALAAAGASHDRELRCQEDIQLPNDLKPGSTYTLYWYWDWPDLDPAHIKVDDTKNGIFPWAGTFMRGEKDPHGFTMAAIAKNESYSSVADIKIVEAAQLPGAGAKAADAGPGNIYTQAIKAQMTGNYQVDIDANLAATGGAPAATGTGGAPPARSVPSSPTTGNGGAATVTVTVTQTMPCTVTATVYVTKSGAGPEPSHPNVYVAARAAAETLVSNAVIDAGRPKTTNPSTPGRAARRNRHFGQ